MVDADPNFILCQGEREKLFSSTIFFKILQNRLCVIFTVTIVYVIDVEGEGLWDEGRELRGKEGDIREEVGGVRDKV